PDRRDGLKTVVFVAGRTEPAQDMDWVLREGQADAAGICHRIPQAQRYRTAILFRRVDASREHRDGRRIEDILEREIEAKACAQTRKHLRHRKGICAEREDVLVDADLVELQEFSPDLDQLPLQFRAGRNHLAAASRSCRWHRY